MVERTHCKMAAGRLGWAGWLVDRAVPICVWINWKEQLGSETDRANPGFQCGEIQPQNLWLKKTWGGWGGRRNSLPHRKVHWRDPQGPITYTNPRTWKSAPKGPNLLVGSGGSDWKPAQSWASGIVPSETPPQHTVPQRSNVGSTALVNT